MQKLSVIQQNKKACPLIIEPHPATYTGFPFITLLQYHKELVLVIVDNVTDDYIKAYVLDLCGAAGIDEEELISYAADWHNTYQCRMPFSVFLSLRGVAHQMAGICRSYSVEFVARVIGPVQKFPFSAPKNTRKRRRKVVPTNRSVVALA
jgi:hypothetical protein